jgi:hypothetical protein
MEDAERMGLTFDANDVGTEGDIEFFGKIVRLQKIAERDVFTRITPAAGSIEKWRGSVKRASRPLK